MQKSNKYENYSSDAKIMEIYHLNKQDGIKMMVEKYSDYIYYIIKQHYPSFTKDYTDMFQNGVIGIIEAMKGYHPDKGSFHTYSTPFIKKEISKHIRFVASESSEYFATVHNSVKRAKTKLETEGKEATVDDVMLETGLSRKIVKREMKVDRTKVSYEALLEMGTSMDLTEDFIIEDMLKGISPMKKQIIKMKVVEELSFVSIAGKLNMSVGSVKKEYNAGIDTLKKQMA